MFLRRSKLLILPKTNDLGLGAIVEECWMIGSEFASVTRESCAKPRQIKRFILLRRDVDPLKAVMVLKGKNRFSLFKTTIIGQIEDDIEELTTEISKRMNHETNLFGWNLKLENPIHQFHNREIWHYIPKNKVNDHGNIGHSQLEFWLREGCQKPKGTRGRARWRRDRGTKERAHLGREKAPWLKIKMHYKKIA